MYKSNCINCDGTILSCYFDGKPQKGWELFDIFPSHVSSWGYKNGPHLFVCQCVCVSVSQHSSDRTVRHTDPKFGGGNDLENISKVITWQCDIMNSFCNWIRILFLIRIWFSRSSSSPINSGTGFAIPVTWGSSCDGYCRTSYTVDWRWRASGKPDSNEEKNSNPKAETVNDIIWHLLSRMLKRRARCRRTINAQVFLFVIVAQYFIIMCLQLQTLRNQPQSTVLTTIGGKSPLVLIKAGIF